MIFQEWLYCHLELTGQEQRHALFCFILRLAAMGMKQRMLLLGRNINYKCMTTK